MSTTTSPPPDPYAPGPPPGGYQAPPPGLHPQPGYGQVSPAQPGYPPPVYYPPPSPGTNVMAIISLVCVFVFAPLAIVFGHIAKKQIRDSGEQGDGIATAGLVLGYVFTGLSLLGIVLVLALAAAVAV